MGKQELKNEDLIRDLNRLALTTPDETYVRLFATAARRIALMQWRTAALKQENATRRAAEEQARESILRAGRDPKWAALYTWLDDNKDPHIKRLSDLTGAQEREIKVLREQLAAVPKKEETLESETVHAATVKSCAEVARAHALAPGTVTGRRQTWLREAIACAIEGKHAPLFVAEENTETGDRIDALLSKVSRAVADPMHHGFFAAMQAVRAAVSRLATNVERLTKELAVVKHKLRSRQDVLNRAHAAYHENTIPNSPTPPPLGNGYHKADEDVDAMMRKLVAEVKQLQADLTAAGEARGKALEERNDLGRLLRSFASVLVDGVVCCSVCLAPRHLEKHDPACPIGRALTDPAAKGGA